ncbi:MAG: hypothetical protein DRJ40_08155 [Thermoprotei archaeon]|nr:MAG: hypothetical protein DRJ40_08155 [Thermoprotei archaeon]
MSSKDIVEKVLGLYHSVATAFAILTIRLLCAGDDLVNQFIASMFVSYNYVVMYMISKALGKSLVAIRVPKYVHQVESRSMVGTAVDEVSAIVCALVTGYIMAYVFAGVTNPVIFLWGFMYGISVKYIMREVLKHLTFLPLDKPRYILLLSAVLGVALGLFGYVMLYLVEVIAVPTFLRY